MSKHVTWFMAGCLLSVPTLASADATGALDVEVEAALEVDVLLALDLPFAVHEARASGISEAEVSLALTSAEEGGVSAAEATEIVVVEVEETQQEGKPKGNFGQWVRSQVAAGVRGKELAEAIRKRKAELGASAKAEHDGKDSAQIKEKLAKQREERRSYREKVREKRAELKKEGRKCSVKGKREHDVRREALAASRDDLVAQGKMLAKGEGAPELRERKGHALGRDGKDEPGQKHRPNLGNGAERAAEKPSADRPDAKRAEKAQERKGKEHSVEKSPAGKPDRAAAKAGAALNLKAQVATSSKED